MAYKDPEEKKRKRHERWEREKAKMAADPEYAERRRVAQRAAEKRRNEKQKAQKIEKARAEGKGRYGKPGRIVALCGWHRW